MDSGATTAGTRSALLGVPAAGDLSLRAPDRAAATPGPAVKRTSGALRVDQPLAARDNPRRVFALGRPDWVAFDGPIGAPRCKLSRRPFSSAARPLDSGPTGTASCRHAHELVPVLTAPLHGFCRMYSAIRRRPAATLPRGTTAISAAAESNATPLPADDPELSPLPALPPRMAAAAARQRRRGGDDRRGHCGPNLGSGSAHGASVVLRRSLQASRMRGAVGSGHDLVPPSPQQLRRRVVALPPGACGREVAASSSDGSEPSTRRDPLNLLDRGRVWRGSSPRPGSS